MARIRLLAPVAGHLADGIPAPAVHEPVEVPDEIAAAWCDGERAEYAEDERDVDAEIEAVHAGAREYLAAVEAQAAERIAQLEAQIEAQLAELSQAEPKPTSAKRQPKSPE
jgi:uncharacterized membrane protein YccC